MKEQNEIELPLDGPNAAPEHHKVIFENDRVRVIDFRVGPGETVPLHTHRYATVNYVITGSDFRSFDGERNCKIDSQKQEVVQTEGSVFYQPAFPPLHSVENIGSQVLRGIAVELKD